MAFDGVLINSVKNELEKKILGGRIDKIRQPERDEIHIGIRAKGENHLLLLSASSNFPRIHLTKLTKNNPSVPPVFCMVLRKHIAGGRIIGIDQPDFERILVLSIESRDELGDISVKKLYMEIMGRHSNIILVDGEGVIIDSVKRITEEISRVRQVMPGKPYCLPPSQNKKNPLRQDEESLKEFFMSVPRDFKGASRWIFNGFTGVSKVTAREIAYRAETGNYYLSHDEAPQGEDTPLLFAFLDFFRQVKEEDFRPILLKDDTGKPIDVLPFEYSQFSPEFSHSFASVSSALDSFYDTRDRIDRNRQKTSHLSKVITTNLERAYKKQGVLAEEYQKSLARDDYRLYGELITANIHRITKGTERVELVNYYDPNGGTIEITLDPRKSPSQNAQMYFKRYRKAENALIMIRKQLRATEDEIKYLESQLNNLYNDLEESDIHEIRQELVEEGYIKRTKKGDTRNRPLSRPHLYLSSDGFNIHVGKNNRQNDRLTLKTAEPRDIWLHTKDIPGSHVIIETKGQEVSEQTLLEGGMLAAFYSKGRDSSNVPVDYCPRKNVRKPKGAKPGMVIYEHYNTIYVTPREEKIQALKKIR